MRRLASFLLFASFVLLSAAPAQPEAMPKAPAPEAAAQVQAAPAHAASQQAPQHERRTALVIGNGAYREGPLKNPVNDARDMAATLKSLGFDVILRENASLRQMEDALDQFWRSLKRGGTGLFFFAGHGMQVRGVNYLVPVDARITVEQDVKSLCLDANRVLGRMEDAGNGLNLVILDACRNNPFARSWRSADAGLAKMDAPTGTLIAYATAPDSVAADGSGRNGVYTSHLLRFLRAPGLKVEDVLKKVRVAVLNDTGRKQTPWESSSLTGDFYFTPAGPEQDMAAAQLALAPVPKERPKQAPLPSAGPQVGDTWTDPVTGMEFVWVPGGTFEMGCGPWASGCRDNEKPAHSVRLDGFWMGKYTVTNSEYRRYKPQHDSGKDGIYRENTLNNELQPVVRVSWEDAKDYAQWLSGHGNGKFRLPTEAEWEYAARSGGRSEKYAGGDDIDRVAWYNGNSNYRSHKVGTKVPNGLGLFDMSGNVWQWCEDIIAPYPSSPQYNPLVTTGSTSQVIRGGGWCDLLETKNLHTTYRGWYQLHVRVDDLGFRLVRIP